MDLVKILEVLKGASPWVVLAGAALIAFYLYLEHRRKSGERTDLDEVRDIAVSVHEKCEETAEMLAAHIGASTASTKDFRESVTTQTQLLSKIAHELISMNAATAGRVISMENAKQIITAQWQRCRDETIRLLANSLHNNHFQGNEKIVARKVYHAWRQVAKTSQSTIASLSGFEYPFQELFNKQVVTAWERMWRWALPIYYNNVADRKAAILDLTDRSVLLFDDILSNYFSFIEDIDEGTLYAPHEDVHPDIRQRSEASISADGQADFSQEMIRRMEQWGPDDESGGYDALDVRNAVEEKYKQTRTEQFRADGRQE